MKALIHSVGVLTLMIAFASAASAATVVPVYADAAGQGFNSNAPPDTASGQDGNPGDTLGEQRRWAFEKALEFWALRLQSTVAIKVGAAMDPLFCSPTSAALGSAGPVGFFTLTPPGTPHPIANTWYPSALVNKYTGNDEIPTQPAISSQFNSNLDTGCFNGGKWYYGLGTPPGGRPSFFEVVLHEVGHGLGVITIVDLSTGAKADGVDDVYMAFLEDHTAGMSWPDLNDNGRMTSATNDGNLHWVGSDVLSSLGNLSSGVSGGHPQMYAPTAFDEGSSVVHWDLDVRDTNNRFDLMRPIATTNMKLLLTDDLLHDIGWNDIQANNCTFSQDRRTVTGSWTGNHVHSACVSVTFDGATIDSGSTSALAGQQIIMQNGFTVEMGATFSANTDPMIGL